MNVTQLCCKSCDAPFAPEHVFEDLAMARCVPCGAVFSLANLATAGPRSTRPKVGMPRGIEVFDMGNSLEIKRRWFTPMFIVMVAFCVFWNGFMLVWHGFAIANEAWIMSAFGLLHTAAGLGVIYYTIAGFLNTTVIRVEFGSLEVKSGPVPWSGNKTLKANDVEQLFCEEKIFRSRHGVRYRYQVVAVVKGNVKETILKGIHNSDQALFIEQELERFLRIEDRPVHGELSR